MWCMVKKNEIALWMLEATDRQTGRQTDKRVVDARILALQARGICESIIMMSLSDDNFAHFFTLTLTLTLTHFSLHTRIHKVYVRINYSLITSNSFSRSQPFIERRC